jgi:BNR repeat protein
MWHWWRAPVHRLVLVAGVGIFLLAGTPAPAQMPGAGGPSGFLGMAPLTGSETLPRLYRGAKGEVFRVWQRAADLRSGGGAVLVAVARPQDRWETLFELRSPEKGVTVQEADLAAGASDNLAIAYQWWRDAPRSKQIRIALGDDGGKKWTQPGIQVDAVGKAFEPRIAWAKGKSLVVVWSDERRGGRLFDVYARRSPDGGATWEPEQLLSRFPRTIMSDIHARPRLLSDGEDRLWTVWVGVRSGRSSLYLNRSVDAGRTWTEPVALTGDSVSVFGHTLVRAGERMLLVWHDTRTGHDRLYAVSSSDGGTSWTEATRVDHLPVDAPVDVNSPTVLLNPDGSSLVAWQDTRNGREDIFLARSSDGGRSWGSEDQRMDMDDPGTGISSFPKLANASDGRIALAWEDDRTGYESVYLRVRSAGPNPQWGPEILVAAQAGKVAARLPELAWASDGLHVVWEVWDYTTAPQIPKRLGERLLTIEGNSDTSKAGAKAGSP